MPLDERLSNELVELWKLYEINEFDVALEKIADVKKNLSGSSSIYSMAALVYEKRAKVEYDRGDVAAYYDDLGNAAKEYEEVVKQNPNSAADRAKLLALKHKLMTSADEVLGSEPDRWTFLKKIPLPVWAAVAVFVVILVCAGIASNMSRNRASSEQPLYPAQVSTPQYAVPPSQSMYTPQTQIPNQNQNRSVGGVYTFPSARLNQAPQTAPYTQQQADAARQRSYDTGYERTLPPIDPVKVEIVPSNNKPKVSTGKPNAPQISLSNGTNGRNGSFEQSNQDQNDSDSDDPDTWLARAIEFEKQGQEAYAMAAAERSHKLFQRNAADGRNVEASENGIELAKGLIRKLENKKR
jgi:hypothetical protein